MLTAQEWINRCKRCIHAKPHNIYDVVCTLPRGVDCDFVELKEGEKLPTKPKRFKSCSVDNSKLTEKYCKRCQQIKPISEFYKKMKNGRIYYASCKECMRDAQRINRARKREKNGTRKKNR